MLIWLARRTRRQKAKKYLAVFKDDVTAVDAILQTLEYNPDATGRQAAEMFAGHALTDEDWERIARRWERAWAAIAF